MEMTSGRRERSRGPSGTSTTSRTPRCLPPSCTTASKCGPSPRGRGTRHRADAASVIDRIVHHATVLTTAGDSYRLKAATRSQAPGAPREVPRP